MKIDVVSGFLGAGKTTLLKKLIADGYPGEQIVLIENEYGDVSVDGTFMRETGVRTTELTAGCICCSLSGDFTETLRGIIEWSAPDRILIEPSGVGKLSDILQKIAYLTTDDVVLNSVVTVVDMKKCETYLENFGEFYEDQIQSAPCIVLSRTDGADQEELEACVHLLRQWNPAATVITTPWDQVSAHQLAEAFRANPLQTLQKEVLAEMEHHHHEHCGCDGHHHEHHHEHHHHHHDGHTCDDPNCACHHSHDAAGTFDCWGKETAKVFSQQSIEQLLKEMDEGKTYGNVLRAKGAVASDEGWLEFDYVPGEMHLRRNRAQVTGCLCVIGTGLDHAALDRWLQTE